MDSSARVPPVFRARLSRESGEAVAEKCPLERMVLETDAPYLASEPSEIPKLAEKAGRPGGRARLPAAPARIIFSGENVPRPFFCGLRFLRQGFFPLETRATKRDALFFPWALGI